MGVKLRQIFNLAPIITFAIRVLTVYRKGKRHQEVHANFRRVCGEELADPADGRTRLARFGTSSCSEPNLPPPP